MTVTWNQDSVIALAPDPESVKAGKSLATKAKWVTLACTDAAVWGECQGSGSKPYQTRIDLSEPAFKCSCPSRKFPCKHALALFLLFAEQRALFPAGEAPGWVSEWLESRGERAQKQAEKRQTAAETQAPDTAVQKKGQADRLGRVAAGLDDLELWMRDLVRSGLASAQTQPYGFWDKPASRLVDAQAPGLARMVRDLAGVVSSGPGWPDRLLARLGKIQLLVDAFRRRDTLPDELQADIRSLLGFPVAKEKVLRGEVVRDRWRVLGQAVEDDPDGMRVQRVWMRGRDSGRWALLLTFVHRSQRFETAVEAMAGTEMDADVAFYPGAAPLRALISERRSAMDPLTNWPGAENIMEGLEEWRQALAQKPWLEEFPLALSAVTPWRQDDRWLVRDPAERVLLLSRRFTRGWELLALSGGRPVGISGSWNGEEFFPLSAWVEGRYVSLAPSREGI